MDTPSSAPWVFSRNDTFPKLPLSNPAKDHVLSGQSGNANLQVKFVDHERWYTHLWLLYGYNGSSQAADIVTTPYNNGQQESPQKDSLSANQWNVVVVPAQANPSNITVQQPQSGSGLLLAHVMYLGIMHKELPFSTRNL